MSKQTKDTDQQANTIPQDDLKKLWDTDSEPEGTFRVTIEKCELTNTTDGQPAIVYEFAILQPGADLDGVKLVKCDVLSQKHMAAVKRDVTKLLGRVPAFTDLANELATLVGNVVNVTTYSRHNVYTIDFV